MARLRRVVLVGVLSLLVMVVAAVAGPFVAHAAVASTTASTLVSSVSNIFAGGVNDFMALFYSVVPKMFLIFVAILVLRFGTKLFKKWAGRSA